MREQILKEYRDDLANAAEYCEENYGVSHGSNYELMAAEIEKWYHERYQEWF